MNIAFVGNFVNKKGSKEFAEFVKKYHDRYTFYIFGYIADEKEYLIIKKYIKKQITYQEGKLKKLLHNYHIDYALVLSIWPETFSRTFFNCLQANVLVVTNQLGFPHRLLNSCYSFFIEDLTDLPSILSSVDENKTAFDNLNKNYHSQFIKKQQLKYQIIEKFLK